MMGGLYGDLFTDSGAALYLAVFGLLALLLVGFWLAAVLVAWLLGLFK